ncbi:phosphotransferase [Caulobacter segnis]|uniref:Phosphotransferase domain-containing protein n=2 Tax=Caulobacter segnis TaxID=88688 RepID=D5VGH6_CAUST|nr:CehA/McbA family metallohydrolase [Caulobacter segnis]ADG10295.1 phosphotransferase domain-containing protein [Caulobacter segnis ATCC 21756]AVQ02032.1 phosphotransferase [Caulobacter segnis]
MLRWLVLVALLIAWPAYAQTGKPDLILNGEITGADHQTYKPVTFDVPAGVARLSIAFDYTGRENRTVVDLGLLDPVRFRGWSGGNKKALFISTEAATASYLPGPLPAGQWTLLLGVPNARPGSRATYEAKVWFQRAPEPPPAALAKATTPGWYRGDLHMHTAHSDGGCVTGDAPRAPCPVYRTVLAALAAGLDFIAVTDHNTTSQAQALAELQPSFPNLLLMTGREVTTFQGHANVFGPTAFIDFRLGSSSVPTIRDLQRAVTAAGGIFSINHPAVPSGEQCMGCGWTAKDTDFDAVQAIEVANGGNEKALGGFEGVLSGVPFWENQLNQGRRITAIGGSDNHDAGVPHDQPSALGRPTTVIRAEGLSSEALLTGLRAGRVFVDLEGTRDRMLDLSASVDGVSAVMGGVLEARPGQTISFVATITGVDRAGLELIQDGLPIHPPVSATGQFEIQMGRRQTWVRINVRDAQGRLLLIGNPIYLSPAPQGS